MNGLVAQYMAAKSSAPRINPVIQNASPAAFTKQQAPVVKPTNIQPTTLNVREIDPYSDLRARERFQEGITSTAFENDRLDSRALFNANRADDLQATADSQQNLRQTNEQNFTASENKKSRDFDLGKTLSKYRADLNRDALQHTQKIEENQIVYDQNRDLENKRADNDFLNLLIEHDNALKLLDIEINRQGDLDKRRYKTKLKTDRKNRKLIRAEDKSNRENATEELKFLASDIYKKIDWDKKDYSKAVNDAKKSFITTVLHTNPKVQRELKVKFDQASGDFLNENGTSVTYKYLLNDALNKFNVLPGVSVAFQSSPAFQNLQMQQATINRNYSNALEMLKERGANIPKRPPPTAQQKQARLQQLHNKGGNP